MNFINLEHKLNK